MGAENGLGSVADDAHCGRLESPGVDMTRTQLQQLDHSNEYLSMVMSCCPEFIFHLLHTLSPLPSDS